MTDKLRECPFCRGEVKVHGPEDWKPTFYDPDSGGDPYGFYCECGMRFDTDSYDYEEAVKRFNARKPMDRIVEQLEEMQNFEIRTGKRYCPDADVKNCRFRFSDLSCSFCAFEKAIEIVKGVQNGS